MTTDDHPEHLPDDDAGGHGATDDLPTGEETADRAPTDRTPTDSEPTDGDVDSEPVHGESATGEPADAGPAEPADAGPAEPADAGPAEPADAGPAEPADPGPAEPTDAGPVAPVAGGGVRTGRRVAAVVLTTLACLLVLFALVAPNQLSLLTPWAFVRIPVEALVVVALVLVLPPRARRVLAAVFGALLGVLTVVKILDMGFFESLDRPFDPVTDWAYFGPAYGFVGSSIGHAGAVAAVVGAALLIVAIVVLMTLAVLRLTRLVVGHRTRATRTIAVLGVVWIGCALTGVQVTPGEPIGARSAAALAYDNASQVRTDLRDEKAFATASAVDAFAGTPGSQLLTGLKGKNVLLVFVESYGQIAVQGSGFSPQVDAVLNAGTRQLKAAGFASESAFLTSSTVGGASWLAHSTVQSGLWINSQQRYDELVAGKRLTLTDAFDRAGWRTVADVPSNGTVWPEAAFFGYDKVYNGFNVGYRGPRFSYAAMPDQYTMRVFQNDELSKPGHTPVMAEIDLVSSHSPWVPLPHVVGWNDLGDGSVFDPMPAEGASKASVLSDANALRTAYGQSVRYSLTTLISYLAKYGDKNTVMVFLGDHQPAPIITGAGADRDVPITIVAKDPAVLRQISGWGWQDGLLPDPTAPVWRMDTFRDRFLTAFSSK
jgi:hypothetical protein